MAEVAKSFSSAAPMLFGEFTKQATAMVEQVKPMKKLNIFLPKSFFWLPPTVTKAAAQVESRAAVQDTSPTTREPARQPNPTIQDRKIVI